MLFSLAGCSSGAATSSAAATTAAAGNAAKPLCWFNRQPSNSSTGELDKTALNFNDKTYYVGFDATQGAELQGKMVADYITAHAKELDRTVMASSVMFLQLVISDIMIPLLVQEAFVLLLEQLSRVPMARLTSSRLKTTLDGSSTGCTGWYSCRSEGP
jgi:ABC-type sugar transport system substrate-binding protein